MEDDAAFSGSHAEKTMVNVSLTKKEREGLFSVLKARFETNMNRHKGLEWSKVEAKLESNAEKR